MKKLISNQVSPNFTYIDSLYVFLQYAKLWSRRHVSFSEFFKTENYILVNAARTALTKIIEVADIPREKKIGIPAFCCAVMATPFLEKGYKIEWIDTDENGVISVESFLQSVDSIGCVLVPHIFGQKAPLAAIREISKRHGIFVIEDCAHRFSFHQEYSDAQIWSFGREKILSCVSGGALLWNTSSPYVDRFRFSLLPLSAMETSRLLAQPVVFALALPFWNWGNLGKMFAYTFSKVGVLPRAVTNQEKRGGEDFPQASLPTALQNILRYKIKKYDARSRHRVRMAQKWNIILSEIMPEAEIIIPENAFRVIVKTEKAQEIKHIAKSWGYDLYEWEGNPIAPKDVHLSAFGYASGQCPNAEYFSQNYITFPTNIRTNAKDIQNFKHQWKLFYAIHQ